MNIVDKVTENVNENKTDEGKKKNNYLASIKNVEQK